MNLLNCILDDLLLLRSDHTFLTHQIQRVISWPQALGLTVNTNKLALVPSQTVQFMGFGVGLVHTTLCLPRDKLINIRRESSAGFLAGIHFPLWKLAQIIDLLWFFWDPYTIWRCIALRCACCALTCLTALSSGWKRRFRQNSFVGYTTWRPGMTRPSLGPPPTLPWNQMPVFGSLLFRLFNGRLLDIGLMLFALSTSA